MIIKKKKLLRERNITCREKVAERMRKSDDELVEQRLPEGTVYEGTVFTPQQF